ncbi:imelysin family protein [Zhongshania sp.]|uniref:imelysin family protein n=1 Tax=Zhongshania sp. TaxID=1971902 RepID=UPI0035650739
MNLSILRGPQARLAKRKLLAITALSLITACSPPPPAKVLADTSNLAILPAYKSFSLSSEKLATAANSFCSKPNTEQLELVRDHWRVAVDGWSGVQNLQFGPLLVDNQAWKIQFWPDKKNLIARKVEALLRSDEALTEKRVDDASVVVQGLSSLEYLLFDPKLGVLDSFANAATGSRRCALLIAVSGHLHSVANGLHDAWRPEAGNYVQIFTQTGEDNPEYPDDSVALANLLDTLVAGVELIKRDKFERPLGLASSEGQAQIYLLEWWRSQYSRDAIIANLKALKNLFMAANGYGLDDYLSKVKQHGEFSTQIQQHFDRSLTAAKAIPNSLFSSAEPRSQAELIQFQTEINELQLLLKSKLPEALGISLGFNAKDGD